MWDVDSMSLKVIGGGEFECCIFGGLCFGDYESVGLGCGGGISFNFWFFLGVF